MLLEVVVRRNERGQAAGFRSQLVKQRAIHLIADAHAKHARAGRAVADQAQQFDLFALLRHAVGQHHDVQFSVGIVVAICRFDRRRRIVPPIAFCEPRNSAARALLSALAAVGGFEQRVRRDVEGDHLEPILLAQRLHECFDRATRHRKLTVVRHAAGYVDDEHVVAPLELILQLLAGRDRYHEVTVFTRLFGSDQIHAGAQAAPARNSLPDRAPSWRRCSPGWPAGNARPRA